MVTLLRDHDVLTGWTLFVAPAGELLLMSARRKKTKAKKPHFPRRLWTAGQKPRVEKPKKGRGSYERDRAGRALRREVEEDLGKP